MAVSELEALRERYHAYEEERVREREALELRIRRQQDAIDILDTMVAEQARYIVLLKGALESAGIEAPVFEVDKVA